MLDVLAELASIGAVVDVVTDHGEQRIKIDAKVGALDAELRDHIIAVRPLVITAILGRRTGHAFAACTHCGQLSMTRATAERAREIATKPSTQWPACRMTPGCEGRHVPSAVELDAVTQCKHPTMSRPPAKKAKARFLGPRTPETDWHAT